MIYFFLLSSFLLNLFLLPLHAILDGRVTPIVVENSYTFTNYEWARGAVYFKKGFSIPSTTTVFMGISAPAKGTINFNVRGTLILLSDLTLGERVTLTGIANIKTNGYEIFILDTRIDLVNPLLFIQDDVTINGLGYSKLYMSSFTSGLSFEQVRRVTLKNILIYSSSGTRIKFPSAGLDACTLDNVRLMLFGSASLTLNTADLFIKGDCYFSVRYGSFVIPCPLTCYGRLFTSDFVNLYCLSSIIFTGPSSELWLSNRTRLVCNNASLATHITGTGTLSVEGRVTLASQNNSAVILDASVNLGLTNKAFLELNNTSLFIK